MSATPRVARELWQLLEPLHAVQYFAPEPIAALRQAGFRGFWMGYFAGRAAPLGRASAQLVHALFYNFDVGHVAESLPDAWTFGSPQDALSARAAGSVATLRRLLVGVVPPEAIDRAASLASAAAGAAPTAGRPLFAANLALPAAEGGLELLWQAATLLREHRGDGHVAVLTASGIDGRAAHVLQALASDIPSSVYERSRRIGAQDWSDALDDLRERGLVDAAGALSEAGRAARKDVEERTDVLAATAFEVLDDRDVEELRSLLRPLARAVVAAGDIPRKNAIGLDLDEVGGQAPS